MATAEFAVVLPAVVLVLALSLGALGLAWDQIRCVDAARAGARAASRGDSAGAVILAASRAAPPGAQVSVGAAGELVRVSVVSRPRVAANLLPAWLRARWTAAVTSARGVGRYRPHDRGSTTLVMLGVIGAVFLLTISGLVLASAVLASHRARAAADLAALAAAGVLMRGGPGSAACATAAQVAAVNHARMQLCNSSATDVRLSVVVPAGVRGVGVATARSRAGPGPRMG